MKKLLVTLTAALICAGAFAQGKVNFVNDSLHLVYFSPNAALLKPADAARVGSGVTSANMPAGTTLVADLYAGQNAGSLALVATTTFGSTAGRYNNTAVNLPAPLVGGVAQTFRVDIRDTNFVSAAAAQAGGGYFAIGAVFTAVPNTGIAFNSIVQHGAPANSTWADGTFDMSTQSGLAGARGVLEVQVVPEPTTFALAGLGAAALMIFRRRK